MSPRSLEAEIQTSVRPPLSSHPLDAPGASSATLRDMVCPCALPFPARRVP
jgi:hypothetical protein